MKRPWQMGLGERGAACEGHTHFAISAKKPLLQSVAEDRIPYGEFCHSGKGQRAFRYTIQTSALHLPDAATTIKPASLCGV
jgi:hypothetical protein